MEQVEVEIVTETHSARYGVLTAGAMLRTDQEYAAHLVDDCGAAKYPKPKAVKAGAGRPVKGADLVQTSAQDPYDHLGTLVAVVPGAADDTAAKE
jgi:hypothetical protein